MEKKKIFISGVAGFLGSHLADRFLEKGYEVIGCDNLIGGDVENVPDGVKFFKEDCGDFKKMRELLEGVDIVYHTACTAHEGLSVFSPSFITRNTFHITATLASAAAQNKVKRFVQCSSMSRYGSNEVPFTEDMQPKPQDPYAIAKVAAEDLIKLLSEVHGFEYVIAVPHNIIGPRQRYSDPFRNVAAIMVNRILQGKQPIIYGDGEQMRCFSFIDDAVDPLVRMATQEGISGEIINIGPDEEFVTINQLARTIAKIMNFELNPIYYPDRPQEVKKATCSSDKARKLLNYNTSCTLEDGLKKMVEEIKEKGAKPFDYSFLELEIINEKTPKTWRDKLI